MCHIFYEYEFSPFVGYLSTPPGSSHPVRAYTIDNEQINSKIFNKNIKSKLKVCEDKLYNYQRSQEMNKTLNNAEILDNAENN
jgi:hypothetical protein